MKTTISVLMGLDEDVITKPMPRFERRMLALKGVKLPSRAAIETERIVLGRKADVVVNVLQGKLGMCMDSFGVQDEVNPVVVALDDILVGVVRSFSSAESHRGNKINIGTLRNMLDKLPELSQQAIKVNYGYNKTQATAYLQACKLVIRLYSRQQLKQLREYAE